MNLPTLKALIEIIIFTTVYNLYLWTGRMCVLDHVCT